MSAEPRPPHVPVIRGGRVFLRAAERDDVSTFVRWFNDGETLSYVSMRAPISQSEEEGWFDRMQAAQGKEAYFFVICQLADGVPVGTISLFDVDQVNGSAGAGIVLGEKRLWGRGMGTDALNALLDFGFGELRLERIWLEVLDYNERGRRSYEKCGFVLEGTQRRAMYRHGRHHDFHLMAILRDEWAALQRPRSWDYADDRPTD